MRHTHNERFLICANQAAFIIPQCSFFVGLDPLGVIRKYLIVQNVRYQPPAAGQDDVRFVELYLPVSAQMSSFVGALRIRKARHIYPEALLRGTLKGLHRAVRCFIFSLIR